MDKFLKNIKREATSAYVYVGFMLIILPSILLMEYWFIVLPAGCLLVPVWIYFRWKNYKKEMKHAIQCKLEILESSLIFHFPNGKTEVDCKNPQRLDVNMKSGEIESLLLTINTDNKVLISGYEKIDEIKQYFIQKVGELNVKQHRWLHKIT